jgi:hypothetical protein
MPPPVTQQQRSASEFCTTNARYETEHPRQSAISDSLIMDLIVGCSLPFSIVENDHFRQFVGLLDKRYTPPSRTTISTYLERKVIVIKKILKNKLEKTETVNCTVDIWSDRKMRGYLAITVHYIKVGDDEKSFELQSRLLTIQRFTGSHTGERIAAAFESVLDEYSIKRKIDYVITDNAANMRKAFTVCFPNMHNNDDGTAVGGSGNDNDNEEMHENQDVDDPDNWEELSEEEMTVVNSAFDAYSKKERLSCFCHSLHLTVSDGLNDTKCMSAAISKASKLSSLLHQSTGFKDEFEKVFGKNKGIPAVVNTRWNSILRQLLAVIGLDYQQLCDLLEAQGHKNLVMTPREWAQISELCDILSPFLEATKLTEGEKCMTIAYVLPAALSLRTHLNEWKVRAKYCQPVVKALLTSLLKRFDGLFLKAMPPRARKHPLTDDKFGSDIYFISAVLDPSFCFQWLYADVQGSERDKEELRREITGMLIIIYNTKQYSA